jgi:hypothetical protein
MPAVETPKLNTDPYPFTHAGKTYSIQSFGAFKAGALRKVRDMDEVSQMFTLVELAADAETLAAIDDMSIPEVTKFFNGWQNAAGVNLPS